MKKAVLSICVFIAAVLSNYRFKADVYQIRGKTKWVLRRDKEMGYPNRMLKKAKK